MGKVKKGRLTLSEEFLAEATTRGVAVRCFRIIDKRRLTEEEEEALAKRIAKPSVKREFNKYCAYHNLLLDIFRSLRVSQSLYTDAANRSLSLLFAVDAGRRAAQAFASLYGRLQDGGMEEEKAREYTKGAFQPASIATGVELLFDLYEGARADDSAGIEAVRISFNERGGYIQRLKEFKAGIIAVEDWEDRFNAEDFAPSPLRELIEGAGEDFAANWGLDEYSRARLKEREERGERITEEERWRAIVPSFEEVRPSRNMIDYWTNVIMESYSNEKGR